MFNREANMHIQGPQIHQFNNVQMRSLPRSLFKRDFNRRTTFNVDYLIPCFVDEILPGDEVNLNMTALARLSTPIKPLMDNLYLDSFWFFIPNRLVWDNWEKFQGQQTNPGDSTTYLIPKVNPAQAPLSTTGFPTQTVWDYFGLPTNVSNIDEVSALYFRAQALCWNEWFRDENLQNSVVIPTGDGPDNPNADHLKLFKRNKVKDYLTSCLPWPQKGTAVSVAIGGTAPVVRIPNAASGWAAKIGGGNSNWTPGANAALQVATSGGIFATGSPTINFDPQGTLQADLSAATPVTINALRQAALYQQILELDARAGTRYVESLFSRFGVISPDFRLQRPELIGQGTSRINVYAVPQTGPTASGQTPQGNLAGFGTAQITGGHGCRYAATEHGMIIGFINVRADLSYQEAVPRMFTRQTRLDFYEPLLNGLGEQAVLRREVDVAGTAQDKEVFGYQERFSEYRYKQSEITGKFRSNDPQTLHVWHLSQFFNFPTLQSAFIEMQTPIARTLATGDSEPHILADMFFSYNHVRVMPVRSNPGISRL